MTGPRPQDPADKAIDAKADGAFGGVSHRAGYGDDKLARVVDFLRRHPRATLASGEGALLLAEIDRMRAAAKDSMDHYADARAEIDRLNAQWERLTSEEAVEAAAWYVVRVAPGMADHGTRLGPWFTEEEADCWIDEHHVKCALYTHHAITAARDAARREG